MQQSNTSMNKNVSRIAKKWRKNYLSLRLLKGSEHIRKIREHVFLVDKETEGQMVGKSNEASNPRHRKVR